MAKNELDKLADFFDRAVSSLVVSGPTRVAKRTIRELQEEGPSWTGRFSNSWQIETPDGRVYKGDGNEGEPRPIKLPIGLLTGRQNIRGSLPLKDRAVTTISNFSDHVAEATDKTSASPAYYKKGWKLYPNGPNTRQGKGNFDFEDSGRKEISRRGEVGGGNPKSTSSRTAPLDWFSTFEKGGRVDKAVRIEMDRALRRFLK